MMTKSMKKNLQTNKGFTLIEVMVAVGLFVTVMLIGVGAVLNTNVTHKRTLAVRQVLDSVNFLVEDMARNIRLGSNYNCDVLSEYTEDASSTVIYQPTISEPADCEEEFSIAFEPMSGDTTQDLDQMAYIIDTTGSGNLESASIKKISYINGIGTVIRDITPALGQTETQLVIDPRQSGFTVIGSKPYPPAGAVNPTDYDTVQPRVIIRLSGYIDYKDKRVPFSVQTTVSQRMIDS
jgi:prepilin-type N-terminal cleavage/methylation domain-containing protein